MTHPTPELKQEVIRLLIDHVVVGKGEIVIKHIVPTDDDCRLQPQRIFTDWFKKSVKSVAKTFRGNTPFKRGVQ